MQTSRKGVRMKNCTVCGVPFEGRQKTQLYCSNRCKWAAYRPPGVWRTTPYPCMHCGTGFVRDHPSKKICPDCVAAAAKPKPKAKPTPAIKHEPNSLYARMSMEERAAFQRWLDKDRVDRSAYERGLERTIGVA